MHTLWLYITKNGTSAQVLAVDFLTTIILTFLMSFFH